MEKLTRWNVSGNFIRNVVLGSAILAPLAARAEYTVPTFISTALTDAGAAFAAIFALVAGALMVVALSKGGFKMAYNWVAKFFSGK